MIKLVVTSDSKQPTTHCFEESSISIGGMGSPTANLKLDNSNLNDCHLQITSQKIDGILYFYAINTANDPFSTLNGLPFGKQPIKNNDLIQTHDITLRFEGEASPDPNGSSGPPSEENKKNINLKPSNLSLSNGKSQKLSLKDYYLSDYDEENQHINSLKEDQTKGYLHTQISKRWRFLGLIVTCLFMLLSGSFALTYFWVSDQSDDEEIQAARGIADVAMALAYAQLKNVQPQNQNLSYHDFLKSNLYAIIEPGSTPSSEFDSHGQFSNCPYMLRIHTNSDLSQCLVIAQPAPSLWQWLIPKASIVIDSLSMEIRKINDIKVLNRLIANTNNLDGTSGIEISNLVKQGTLIPLSSLAGDGENQGFVPPVALKAMKPGAENLVYNAPRYYLLGEAILETSLNMMDHFTAPGEIQILQQELGALMQYPDIVLYSSEGIENALESQKALRLIAPKDKFLVGYLELTSKGRIAGAELLNNTISSDKVLADRLESHFDDKETLKLEEENLENVLLPPALLESSNNEEQKDAETNKLIDITDPIFLHLTAVMTSRTNVLKPITDEIIDLLKRELTAPQSDFTSRFTKLQKTYLSLTKEELAKLEKKFESISNEYAHLPASTLIEYIKEANADGAFHDYLTALSLNSKAEQITDEKVGELIKKIENSKSWQELESAVLQANQLLRFVNIPASKRLISLQNSTRLVVTQKLNQFILSSDSSLPSHDFAPDDLQSLSNILKNSWIIDPETYDFYIDEFELREPQP